MFLKRNYYLGNERGIALIVTLLITAVLVAVITEFAYRTYVSTARTNLFRDSQRAALLAANGVELARIGLKELLKNDPYRTGAELFLPSGNVDDESSLEIKAIDEAGKVSVLIAFPRTGAAKKNNEEVFARLLRNMRLDEGLKDTLADWIDTDDAPRPKGAEGPDHYQGQKPPYAPRNNTPETIDELLMVKGFNMEAFEKLQPFISAHNINGQININTAPKEVLLALSDEMTPELAQRIIDFRNKTPFEDRSEIIKVSGFEKLGYGLQDRITVTSSVYRVFSKAKVNGSQHEAEAVMDIYKGIIYWRED